MRTLDLSQTTPKVYVIERSQCKWCAWMCGAPKGVLLNTDQVEELYYCCEWTYCPLTKQSWLAAGGVKGVIRVIK